MVLLHGSWFHQPGSAQAEFLLWGETWRRCPAISWGDGIEAFPCALDAPSLQTWLNQLPLPPELLSRIAAQGSVVPLPLALPTQMDLAASTMQAVYGGHQVDPQVSGADLVLHPWSLEGIRLDAATAIAILQALPLGQHVTWLGGDLRFWSQIARWSLDLLARGKFLPTVAGWHILLDSEVDRERLQQFSQAMPPGCRFSPLDIPLDIQAQDIQNWDGQNQALPLPASPIETIQAALAPMVTAQLQPLMPPAPPTLTTGAMASWLHRLGGASDPSSPALSASPFPAQLAQALTQWQLPLQGHQTQFRVCLQLHPPAASSSPASSSSTLPTASSQWQLEFWLQALDDPDFLVSAPTLWNNPVDQLTYQGRTIPQPQETFLMGLGLASRIYPLLEGSLQVARPQFCALTPLQAYDFLKTTLWRLQDSGFGVKVPPSLASGSGSWANRLGLEVKALGQPLGQAGERLSLRSLLDLSWTLTIGGQTLTKRQFDQLVTLNMPLVEINGEWVELRPQDIRAAQDFFAKRSDTLSLSLEDALRISSGETHLVGKLPVVNFELSGALEQLFQTLSGRSAVEAIAPPTAFKGELRPYQARGVGWLKFLGDWGLGACLADDMGLGKTVQLIAFLLTLFEAQQIKAPVLLVCPTSVLGNWEREVHRFGPPLQVLQYHGDKRPQGKQLAKAVADKHLVLTSYALVQRDIANLEAIAWQGVVLDEAQNIKNPDSKQSQAVRQLNAEFRIALTGTPVENRLAELWSILDFLNPGYLGPRNFFQRRFATPIERYGDRASLQTLRALVQPFILRRLKTDKTIIQDLPEKQENTVFCGLSPEQANLYQTTVEACLGEIESAEGIQRKGLILALLVKLKQLCNHPELLNAPSPSSFSSRSGKLQRLEAMLEEVILAGDRALIFSQFTQWGKQLQTHLSQTLDQEVLFLSGSQSKAQREALVDRFQLDPQGPRIFILSLKAGGVGLNLTRANHVFHYDRWWNPAVENQATDRVFRIGQTRNVQVHKFVCQGTLEEKIHDLIESKKALAENVVGAGENWLTELNSAQLRSLLLLDRTAVIED